MVKRLYPTQPVVGIGAIILRKSEILLEQRGNEPALGQWTIPGGVVEVGETLEDAVRRETKEETGIEVQDTSLIDVVDQVHLDKQGRIEYHYVIIDYLVKVKPGEPKAASDAKALKWVPLGEVEGYDLTPSFRRFFVKNKERLESATSSLDSSF
ncbi:MAG TPA: NUDIX hydrolase [Candidatus Nanoarchaeia archaeon]|nr:NUDIX hydrolase [Candidatus Nanoarchaeia archaeon]